MKVLLAPDKFKGCLSAAEVARAMAEGVRRVDASIEIDQCPLADGGEGTVEALVRATHGRIVTRHVTGPLPRMKVEAPIGILGDGFTAVIEMASASGLYLLKPEQRDPTRTTTYGTGELLHEALRLGAKRVILGIGGSATVDGGIGVAQAWDASIVLDTGTTHTASSGRRLTGGDLVHLRSIHFNLAREAREVEFIVACDVGNPLLGPDGAAAVFGPQKGAAPRQVEQLDAGLARLVERTRRHDLADLPGAGAAGGLGFGMMAFFNATLKPGIEIVMDAIHLRQRLARADLCITGEGKLDVQSLGGKTAIGVASASREQHVPCIAVCGAVELDSDAVRQAGLSAAFSIARRPMTLEESMRDTRQLLADATREVVSAFMAKR
jgi:glycerate kinase